VKGMNEKPKAKKRNFDDPLFGMGHCRVSAGERQDKKRPLTFLITSEVLVLRGRVSKSKSNCSPQRRKEHEGLKQFLGVLAVPFLRA
jgi:hypothetical protein